MQMKGIYLLLLSWLGLQCPGGTVQCNSPGARLNPASVPDLAPATGMEVRKLELSRPELSSEAYLIHSPEKDRPDYIEVPEEEMQRLKAKGRLRILSLVVPVALPQHLYWEEGSSPCPLEPGGVLAPIPQGSLCPGLHRVMVKNMWFGYGSLQHCLTDHSSTTASQDVAASDRGQK